MPNCVADSNTNYFLSPKTFRNHDRRSKSSEFYILQKPSTTTMENKIAPKDQLQQQQPLLDRVAQLVEEFTGQKKGFDVCPKTGNIYKCSTSNSSSCGGSTDSSNSINSNNIYHYPPQYSIDDIRRPSLPSSILERNGMLHSSSSSSSTDSSSLTAVASEPGNYSSLLRTLRTQAESGTLVPLPERSPSPRARFVRNIRNNHNHKRRQQSILHHQRQQTPPPQINIISNEDEEEKGKNKEDTNINGSIGGIAVCGSIQRRKKVFDKNEEVINENNILSNRSIPLISETKLSPRESNLSRGYAQKMSLISKNETKNDENSNLNTNSLSIPTQLSTSNSASISDFREALASKQINEGEVKENQIKYCPCNFANNLNEAKNGSNTNRSSTEDYCTYNSLDNRNLNKHFNKFSSPPLSPTSLSSMPLSTFAQPKRLGSQKFIPFNNPTSQNYDALNNNNSRRRRSGFEGMLTGGGGTEWKVFRQMARILRRDNTTNNNNGNTHRRGESQSICQQSSPPVSPFFGNCANRRRYSLAPALENSDGDFMDRLIEPPQLQQQQHNQQKISSPHQSPSSTITSASNSPFCSPQSNSTTTTDGIIFNNNNNGSTTTITTSAFPFFPRAQLNQSRWADLDLWAEQEPSWTAKYGNRNDGEISSLNAKELKRQNIIYELVLTERHHCQVLVLLQQLYYEGLARNKILTPKQLHLLIPDVEALLDFHLSFLRCLIERCSISPIVDGISDILLTEFGSGNYRNNAINAYTAFCLSREDSARQYSTLITQNVHFRKFMEYYEGQHKDRSLKDCMLLVAQRLTKYPVLVEQIAKQESQQSKQLLAQKAHSIVREFAMQVDQQLMQHELNRQWNALKKALDKSAAIAKMIHPKDGIEFTFDDLVWPVENESTTILSNNNNTTKTIGKRKILLITRAFWRETMNGPELELRLLLCDDVIVFLRPKGSGGSSSSTANGVSNNSSVNTKLPPLQFFRHIAHSGVLPLHSILVRGENVRRKSLLLIVTAKQRPDLFEFAFSTSVELDNFALAIKKAKAEAPNFVRLSEGRCFEFADKPIGDGMGKPIINSDDFKIQMENWKLELDKLFEQRNKEEADLENYFESRMLFMDRLRALVERLPRRRNKQKGRRRKLKGGDDNEEKNEDILKNEENNNKEEEEYKNQQKAAFEHLRNRFRELEKTRVEPLIRLIEKAKKVRDADLVTFFDDLYDLGGEEEKSFTAVNVSGDSATSAEEQPRVSDEDRRPKPRRVRTYHGATDKRKKGNSDGSSCSSSGGASAIRRHTTFPSSGRHNDGSSEDEDDEEEEDECLRQLLPLRMGAGARRVATELIRENLRLRTQLNRLKAKTALQEIWLTAAMQKGEVNENELIITNQNDEEGKKQIDDELAVSEAKVLKVMARDLARREAEIERKEANIKAREEEIASTSLLNQKTFPNTSSEHSTSSPSTSATKQGNNEKKSSLNKQQHLFKENQQTTTTTSPQQLLKLEKEKEFEHLSSPSTSNRVSTTTIRICNTYCGAGPVPSSSNNIKSNKKDNNNNNSSSLLFPSSLSSSHLIQTNIPQQQFNNNNNNRKCSAIESNNNNISFERRALSHAELPVHLAVKTETKQRRK